MEIAESVEIAGYDRVRAHTAPMVNAEIDRATQARVAETVAAGPVGIGRRLAELDREWDVDRALMANFVAVGGLAFFAGAARRRPLSKRFNGWQAFTTVQLGFLMLHAAVGWCPPASLFRRLGFRTQREIQTERSALLDALEPAGVRP